VSDGFGYAAMMHGDHLEGARLVQDTPERRVVEKLAGLVPPGQPVKTSRRVTKSAPAKRAGVSGRKSG
jgi:hypothetical protein